MDNEIHKCTACSCDYTDDEGGVQGYFGIMLMSFCPTCLSSIYDMMEQLNPREWIGLTDEDVQEVEGWIDFKEAGSDRVPTGKLARYIENKLRVANGFE